MKIRKSSLRHRRAFRGGFHGISNNIDFFPQSGWTAIVLSNYTVTGFEACALVVVKMRELVQASVSTADESSSAR